MHHIENITHPFHNRFTTMNNKIWHDGLFLKLKDLGVTDKLWNILFMSYKQASAHVQYNGFISNNFAISQGEHNKVVFEVHVQRY
jgi:hypothetical protein